MSQEQRLLPESRKSNGSTSNVIKSNVGSGNGGSGNVGSSNEGSGNVGSSNEGTSNGGSSNGSSSNVGTSNLGSSNVGTSNGGTSNVGSTTRRVGLVATGVLCGSLVALYAAAAPFVLPALRRVCLPFVPATPAQVDAVLRALRSRSGTLVDIGSGDGRIVIAAAKRGFQASGFELNPWLVWYSRYKAWREGVHHSTSFHISDLWKVSFSQYSNVVIFGVPQMMDQLELKLGAELQSTARVVACRFPFPRWVPDHMAGEGIDTVWVYDAETFKAEQRDRTDAEDERTSTS